MKRTQFKSMVKEIIREVVSEMDTKDPTADQDPMGGSSADPTDAENDLPVDMTGIPTEVPRDQEIRWRALQQRLQNIKKEPKFIDKLDQFVRAQELLGKVGIGKAGAPAPVKTPTVSSTPSDMNWDKMAQQAKTDIAQQRKSK